MPEAFTTGMTVFLATNVAKFKKDMLEAGSSVEQFGHGVRGTLKGLLGVSHALQGAAIAAGAAMGGVAAVAAHAAGELETQINNVATVWDEAGQKAAGTLLSLGDASDQLVDVSTRLPQSAVELATALYDVASSGFQGTDAIKVMTAAAEAASAGLTTTTVAVRGITAVLNAYGLGANQASHISDILFQTVNLGVVTFEELAGVMGDFVGMAATANVPIEEANAALAAMTLNGISAAEASTSLNRILQEFIEPTTSLTALLSDMGYESGVLAIEQEGLDGILTKIDAKIGGNVESYATLFDEIRAVRGVLALTSGEGENYARIVGTMTNETELFGQTQKALDKQSNSTSYQMTLLKNTIQAIAIDFGKLLLPAIRFVVEAIGDFAAGFRALPGWMKGLTYAGSILIGVLGIVAALFVSNAITSKLFSLAMKGVTYSLNAAGFSAVWVARAITILKVSMGIVAGLLTVATVALTLFGKSQDDVGAGQEDLNDTLDETTGAITAQTGAFVRDRAIKKGWDDDARALGVTMDDLTKALLGDEDAINRVNAARAASVANAKNEVPEHGNVRQAISKRIEASERLGDAIKSTSADVKTGTAAVAEEARALKVDKTAADSLTTARQKEQAAAVAQAEAHIDAMKVIQKELDTVFSLSEAYAAAAKEGDDAASGSDKTADRARQNRHKAESDLLDDLLKGERDHLDDVQDTRRRAQDDQQEAERNAFEQANRDFERQRDDRRRAEDEAFEESAKARQDALDEQHQAETDALDLSLRTQKNGLDDRLRAERDAFDDRMAELRRQNDELVEDSEEAWEARKDEIQFMIDGTFGAEREGWKQQLKDEEDAHEDSIAALEKKGDDQIRTEENAQDDRERAAEQGWDDFEKLQRDSLERQQDDRDEALRVQLDGEKTARETRRRDEDQAWDDLIRLDAQKMDERFRAQTRHLDDELKAEVDGMDKRHEARKNGLEAIQTEEDDAADTRLKSSKEKHVPTFAELQAQVDKELEQRRQFYRDQVTIAEQGGEKINAAVMAKIVELGPEAVRTIATGSPSQIQALVNSIAQGIEVQDAGPIEAAMAKWGEAGGRGFVNGFQGVLGPAPVAVSGMFNFARPIAPSADGNIFRRAEGHYAQIAPAGAWRVWAEPETGGEAYIPLAGSKRARSTGILAQVAEAFGYGLLPMANGGILAGGGGGNSGPLSVSMPISIDARVAAGVDPDAVGRAVAVHAQRAVEVALDSLGRNVNMKAWRTR